MKDDYEEHKDLLWIDEEEVYDGEYVFYQQGNKAHFIINLLY